MILGQSLGQCFDLSKEEKNAFTLVKLPWFKQVYFKDGIKFPL